METEKVIENIKEAKLILLCNNIVELIVVINEGQKCGLFKNKFWDLENDEELDLNKLKDIAIILVLKELEERDNMIQKIHENFCKFDWKNSNGEQVHNQLKELYESIFRNEEAE